MFWLAVLLTKKVALKKQGTYHPTDCITNKDCDHRNIYLFRTTYPGRLVTAVKVFSFKRCLQDQILSHHIIHPIFDIIFCQHLLKLSEKVLFILRHM